MSDPVTTDPTVTDAGAAPGPPSVLFDVDPRGIATITLNRPERGNAYDDRMLEALNDGLDALAANALVRVLVLRGAGRHFQAGADIEWLSQAGLLDARGAFAVANAISHTVARLDEFPHPSIAVVQGACYVGGCGLACCADVLVATQGAVFGLTEARAGIAAPPIPSHIINAIGAVHARRLAMTGERFGVEEARRIGLVDEVIEAARLEARLAAMLEAILLVPLEAPAAELADVLNAGALAPDARRIAKLALEGRALRRARGSGEGPSFRERRRPGWLLSQEPEES